MIAEEPPQLQWSIIHQKKSYSVFVEIFLSFRLAILYQTRHKNIYALSLILSQFYDRRRPRSDSVQQLIYHSIEVLFTNKYLFEIICIIFYNQTRQYMSSAQRGHVYVTKHNFPCIKLNKQRQTVCNPDQNNIIWVFRFSTRLFKYCIRLSLCGMFIFKSCVFGQIQFLNCFSQSLIMHINFQLSFICDGVNLLKKTFWRKSSILK